ncbi:MAG: NYN domain-containing protein [Microbacteriaceae bacterium]
MPQAEPRVAVYLDFDNIVISQFDQEHGRGQFQARRVRALATEEARRMATQARVDIGAIIDYASSFGTVVVSRAYADWSAPVNAGYRDQLIDRAVDLVQLFTATAGLKNGADIRLAVDAVEDLFRLDDLTHVVIVAGDSDYIALAQRCRRLGRYVVGIGVAGSTSRSLASACDEFTSYGVLPGVASPEPEPDVESEPEAEPDAAESAGRPADTAEAKRAASALLVRALRVGHAREDTEEWLNASEVKGHMIRMDPSFSEKALGFSSFTKFVQSRANLVELREQGQKRLLRLRER